MGELVRSQTKNMKSGNCNTENAKFFASCDFCNVNFMDQNQLNQHMMYHQSEEFFNLWLIFVKRYQQSNPDSWLEPVEITKPSAYYKFKPNAKNCVPKTPRVTDWDLAWEEWDATGKYSNL